MSDEKKDDPQASPHTVATVKVSAADVQQWIARSAMAGHHWPATADAAGIFTCALCGKTAHGMTMELQREACPKAAEHK
jgi:hypothetical protein